MEEMPVFDSIAPEFSLKTPPCTQAFSKSVFFLRWCRDADFLSAVCSVQKAADALAEAERKGLLGVPCFVSRLLRLRGVQVWPPFTAPGVRGRGVEMEPKT